MKANALLITTIAFMSLGLHLLTECRFLIPYRRLLWARYGTVIGLFGLALFANLFAVIYLGCRKLFLNDTGRKLAHLEKQLRTGASISAELSERLEE
jgi:hypothetical protein